jgi:hypothetical protein
MTYIAMPQGMGPAAVAPPPVAAVAPTAAIAPSS